MDVLLMAFALLLLMIPGTLLAFLIVPEAAASRRTLITGYGILLGLVGVPVIMRFLNALGMPLSFAICAAAVAMVAGALLATAIYRGGSLVDGAHTVSVSAKISTVDKVFMGVLFALIALRIGGLAVDVIWRPVFGWDATMHWATKTRVWFEYLELRPFIENADWLNDPNTSLFTDHHPGYPITIPLLQLWMTTAIGQWDESLMNLPWLLCVVGLGLAFYGQAREAGAGAMLSLVFTYFLLSMPLLNAHVALAGYADLFLGACYCLAMMAFHNWSMRRAHSQAVLATLFAVSCVLIKNEGVFWLLTFVPALLMVFFPGKKALLLLLGLALIAFALLAVFPRDLVFAGHSLQELNLFYRPGAFKAVFDSLFLHDNWHLFSYLLVSLIVLALLFRRSALMVYSGVGVALAAATCLFLFLFVFTAYSGGALRFTAVGRISLQLVPAFMFFCLLLAKDLLGPPESKNVSLKNIPEFSSVA
ncbi:hypothetical protein R0135_14480 [Congregibacter variabilis]|uniref:Glycosyltransferase RgtA/B/C/D-like domain-containing protein n=1 Tax=Congregibacter variabilis TaxID=3081200 RepID=A0ABZ0I0C6_9GAMM|nr:hypothetical protein R0135_14480 [Congregibacter sp. IMCC43200]